MNGWTKFFGIVFTIYALLWFIIFTLIVFPFVIVFSFFGKLAGGNMLYRLCNIWADAWYFLLGIRHRNLFESEYDPAKTYIFISNHISYLDIPCIFKAIRRQPFRVLGKAELRKIPVFGFIYGFGAVTVERDNTLHRAQSVRQLKTILRRHVSVFIFPEGTFNETRNALKPFYDGAFRISIETQTPIKPILFLDNYTLMNYRSLFSLKHGKSRVVFLEEISPEGFTLPNLKLFKEKVFREMERKLEEYKVPWINLNT